MKNSFKKSYKCQQILRIPANIWRERPKIKGNFSVNLFIFICQIYVKWDELSRKSEKRRPSEQMKARRDKSKEREANNRKWQSKWLGWRGRMASKKTQKMKDEEIAVGIVLCNKRYVHTSKPYHVQKDPCLFLLFSIVFVPHGVCFSASLIFIFSNIHGCFYSRRFIWNLVLNCPVQSKSYPYACVETMAKASFPLHLPFQCSVSNKHFEYDEVARCRFFSIFFLSSHSSLLDQMFPSLCALRAYFPFNEKAFGMLTSYLTLCLSVWVSLWYLSVCYE